MADEIIGKISVGDGATFTPSVNNSGVISWTNNKNLENPASVDLPAAVIDRYQLAPIASPAFTGTPTAPTPTPGDSSINIATTAYVQAELEDYLALTGGTITGNLSVSGTITGNLVGNADTATNATNATNDGNGNEIATTYLPLSGGTITGNVFAPTPAQTDDSTKIATTAYVKDCVPKSVGDSNTPVYVNSNGVVTSTGKSFANYTPIAKSVGGTQRPVYTNANGVITACTATGSVGGLEGITYRASGSNSSVSGWWHIKLSSGLEIETGNINDVTSTEKTITYGHAFDSTPRVVVVPHARIAFSVGSEGTTNFKVRSDNTSKYDFRYIAVAITT